MNKQYDLDINKVFFYESHRKKIISELKKRHNLKLNDILFLHHLKTTDSRRISLHKVKQSIDFSLMEIHKSLTALTENGIIGKENVQQKMNVKFLSLLPMNKKKK
ncbi:staphylococcal accessory regulator family protein [Staphylococcus agnetis]|uniref:transcriptional regulator, SarA/Rot family n=1 Tax=Staphylococcus agnetis TaxID=985762 RepID=UPI000E033C45|nr:regulator [Staphylococcus agnetis]SUK14657.1 staphylococcal accessory regulator family protein [Staphylococcus agnetis]